MQCETGHSQLPKTVLEESAQWQLDKILIAMLTVTTATLFHPIEKQAAVEQLFR